MTILLQAIPTSCLLIYMLYMTWYYAIPSMRLRSLMFYAHRKYAGIDIRFGYNSLTVCLPEQGSGPEPALKISRTIDPEIPARHLMYEAGTELKTALKELRERLGSREYG